MLVAQIGKVTTLEHLGDMIEKDVGRRRSSSASICAATPDTWIVASADVRISKLDATAQEVSIDVIMRIVRNAKTTVSQQAGKQEVDVYSPWAKSRK